MNGLETDSLAWAWLLGLIPVITVIIAVIGAWVGVRTLRFRSKVDSAGQWWMRVQNAIDHCLADSAREQNLGTTMLDHLQDQGQMPADLSPEQQRQWQRINKMRWTVQPEDLLLIHGIVKELALAQAQQLNTLGIRQKPGYDTLMRQAQLALKIDAKLGRAADPQIMALLTGNVSG